MPPPRPVEAIATEIGSDVGLDDPRYAAEYSPAMRAALEEWPAAVERAPQARSLPDS